MSCLKYIWCAEMEEIATIRDECDELGRRCDGVEARVNEMRTSVEVKEPGYGESQIYFQVHRTRAQPADQR